MAEIQSLREFVEQQLMTKDRSLVLDEIGNYLEARLVHEALSTETWTTNRIREIVRQEIAVALRGRDTIPAPSGDSHSGAVVVPRGSSNPPIWIKGHGCQSCGMTACVCTLPDGDGEGAP